MLLAGLTFGSRLAGALLMHAVKISPAVERFLDALSVSVVAALAGSIIAQGDLRSAVAVGLAAIIMLAFRSAAWAMFSGMAAAAVWTQIALT